jgi:hypothetical protein
VLSGDYEFVRDITYGRKFPLPSAYRKRGVTRYWTRLKILAQADKLLILLHSFTGNATNFNVPDTLTRGIPLFSINPRTGKPVLFSR